MTSQSETESKANSESKPGGNTGAATTINTTKAHKQLMQLAETQKNQPKEFDYGKYSKEIAYEICDVIAGSREGLDRICKANDQYPSSRTFHRWLNDSEDLCQRYLRARKIQAAYLIDEIIPIADDSSGDTIIDEDGNERFNSEYVQRAKLRVDSRFRLAGKLDSSKWGDRVQTETTTKSVEVKIDATMTPEQAADAYKRLMQ